MAQPKQSHQVTRQRLIELGVQTERRRVLEIINEIPRASLHDGRDLVVRTDIIRKVQH